MTNNNILRNIIISVAYYKVNETLEWIGENLGEGGFTIITDETWTENYTESDYFIKKKRMALHRRFRKTIKLATTMYNQKLVLLTP